MWERGLGGGQFFECLQRLGSNLPYCYSSPSKSPSWLLDMNLREAVPHWIRVSFYALIPIPGLRSINWVPETMIPRTCLNLQSMFITPLILIYSVDLKPPLGTLLPPSSQLLRERPSAAPLTSPTRTRQATNSQCTLIVSLDSLNKASYYWIEFVDLSKLYTRKQWTAESHST